MKKRKTRRLKRRKVRKTRKSRKSRKSRKMKGGASPTTTKNRMPSIKKSPESWKDRRFDASRAPPPLSLREKYRYILNMANAPDWIAPKIASLRRTLDELTDEDLEGLGELQRQLPLWEEFSKIYQKTITH